MKKQHCVSCSLSFETAMTRESQRHLPSSERECAVGGPSENTVGKAISGRNHMIFTIENATNMKMRAVRAFAGLLTHPAAHHRVRLDHEPHKGLLFEFRG